MKMVRCGVAALVVLFSLAFATPAFAAKTHHHAAVTATPTVTATPNPVAVGQQFTIDVSGLPSFDNVDVFLFDSGGTTVFNASADVNGLISFTTQEFWVGTTTIDVNEFDAAGNSTVVASTTLSVV